MVYFLGLKYPLNNNNSNRNNSSNNNTQNSVYGSTIMKKLLREFAQFI